MFSRPFLRQSSPSWSHTLCGHGPATLGRAGCLVTSIAQAARLLGTDPTVDPPHLVERGIEADAFVGSNVIIPRLAAAVGLQAPTTLRVESDKGAARMLDVLLGSLDGGWLGLLRTDRSPTSQPHHHWMLATAVDGERIVCADPATGRAAFVDVDNLRGYSQWGSGPIAFSVDAVVPIGPLH